MKLKSITIKAIGHDLKTHEFSGPLLSDFLSNAGVILGEPAKKQTVSNYITIRARDNYKCVFALAELDPLFSSSSIIIASKMDGKALSENNDPYQIIVPNDKKHGRWVRQVKSIELHVLKQGEMPGWRRRLTNYYGTRSTRSPALNLPAQP